MARYWLTNFLGSPTLPAPFANLVSDIVVVRTKEQMIRVYTDRIVTLMKNVHTSWNRSVMQPVTKTMHSHGSVIDAYLPVAIRFATPSFAKPVPAIVSFSNLSPKSILRFIIKRVAVFSKSSVVGSTITKTSRLLITTFYFTNSIRSIRHSSFSWLSSLVTSQHSPIVHFAHLFRVSRSITIGYNTSHVVKYKGVN